MLGGELVAALATVAVPVVVAIIYFITNNKIFLSLSFINI